MDLRITFRGLCLFVRSKNGKHLDVLFPETIQHARHRPDHVHEPRVRYNGMTHSGKLRKFALRFDGLKGAGSTLPELLPNLLPAGLISNKTVPPGKLGDHPGNTVASQLSVPVPDRVLPGEKAWFFRIRPDGSRECRELTHEVTLVYVGVDAGKLKPRLRELGNVSNDAGVDEPQTSGGNVITVVVTHLPGNLGATVCAGEPVPHAHLYYAFLGAADDPLILDENPGVGTGCGNWTPRCGRHVFSEEFLKRDDSGTAFNCMLAQASPA